LVEAAGACHQTITAALQKRHRDDAQCVAVVAVEIRGQSAAAFIAEEVAEGGEAALEGAGLAALGKLCLAQLQRYGVTALKRGNFSQRLAAHLNE